MAKHSERVAFFKEKLQPIFSGESQEVSMPIEFEGKNIRYAISNYITNYSPIALKTAVDGENVIVSKYMQSEDKYFQLRKQMRNCAIGDLIEAPIGQKHFLSAYARKLNKKFERVVKNTYKRTE